MTQFVNSTFVECEIDFSYNYTSITVSNNGIQFSPPVKPDLTTLRFKKYEPTIVPLLTPTRIKVTFDDKIDGIDDSLWCEFVDLNTTRLEPSTS